MNCRTAQQLASAARDGALTPSQRTALDAHVGLCEACQAAVVSVDAAIKAWRAENAQVVVPNSRGEWLDVQRKIHAVPAREEKVEPEGTPLLRWVMGIAIPVTAALAVAWLYRGVPAEEALTPEHKGGLTLTSAARAEFVEAPEDVTTMIYVDQQSGWLIVWADSDAQPVRG